MLGSPLKVVATSQLISEVNAYYSHYYYDSQNVANLLLTLQSKNSVTSESSVISTQL